MNQYKQQLLELSTELYQRAADKAKKYQRGAKQMKHGHVTNAVKHGEVETLLRQIDTEGTPYTKAGQARQEKYTPNLALSRKYGELGKERKQQVGKFSAAAKGVKTKRPHRGYPLGAYQKNLVTQTKIELKKDKNKHDHREDENIINNFEKNLANRLLEMDRVDYISSSPEKVMSGATRAFRKGARKARTTGVGNELENCILTVPRTYRAVRRRARQARNKYYMKTAVNAAFGEKA